VKRSVIKRQLFESLYSGQFTLSTPLINQIFVIHSSTDVAPHFLLESNPLYWFEVNEVEHGRPYHTSPCRRYSSASLNITVFRICHWRNEVKFVISWNVDKFWAK